MMPFDSVKAFSSCIFNHGHGLDKSLTTKEYVFKTYKRLLLNNFYFSIGNNSFTSSVVG